MKPRSLAWLLTLAVASVSAETFTVSRTDDPLPDGCAVDDCSLREALEASNANDPFAPNDQIVLGAGTHVLVRGDLPIVSQNLVVSGAGADQTRIESDAALFELTSGASREVQLSGMTLDISVDAESAAAVPTGLLDAEGIVVERGRVTAFGDGNLHVRDSELGDRVACNGSGSCTFEDTSLPSLYANPSAAPGPDVILRRCLVDGDLLPDYTLTGIVIHHGTTVLEDTTLTHLDVGVKAMNPDVNLNLHRIHYLDNHEPIRTEVPATVAIEDSLFEANLVRALYAAGGADWTVTGSTFVGNRVDGNAGGAIVLEDDTELHIRNSTFSANGFTVDAAANGARGAAIGYRNGSGAQLVLQHVTIVRPAVMPVGVLGTALGGHDAGVTVDISNSIINGSCGFEVNVLQNNAGNIEVPGDSCGLDDQANQVNVAASDLAIGTLADHGGPTPTYQPAPDSVAVDTASTPQCLPTDQRGYGRPAGIRCDVGALEIGAVVPGTEDIVFVDGFEEI